MGSHPKEVMSPQTEYDRKNSYFSLSSCPYENSPLQTVPSNPDASGHVVEEMKSYTSGPRPDHLASYPTTDSQLTRSYPAAAKAEFSLDYNSEYQCKKLDRSATFSNCTGQSVEHNDEIVDLPRGAHCMDETTSFSSQQSFDNAGPSVPRGLQYGHEIPSLSTHRCNVSRAFAPSNKWEYGAEIPSLLSKQCYGDEIPSLSTQKSNGISRSTQCHYGAEIPSFSNRQDYGGEIPLSTRKFNGISRSSQWQYGSEIPSLTSRQSYGDEIPSLSRHSHYQDKIPLYSGRRFHAAEAHRSRSDQQGPSHRCNYEARSKHAVTRPQVVNRVVNTTNHCRFNKKEITSRNSEDTGDQVCGPRANKLNNASTLTAKKNILSPLISRDQFNRPDFSVQYEHAKFFMIKSYNEDDIHKGIKYNVWASTPNGNNKLDAAFHESQILTKEKGTKCPVFLFFSVNTSGQFVGLAEMLGPVDFKKTMDFWRQDKWSGFFPVIWHIIKDIPNRLFKHITLENNDNKPVTFSRDTQEIGLPQGLEVLKIFKAYHHATSFLDDFDFYEEKENTHCAQKGINVDSLHQARLSYFETDDIGSMENLDASMGSMSFYETWE